MTVLDRFATIFFSKKDNISRAIIWSVTLEAGAVGLATAQIVGDRFVLLGMQIDMILRLAKVYGKRLDRAGAIALGKSILASVVGPEAVNQALKYFPVLGNIANMSVASSVTALIGHTSVKMFKDGSWFEKSRESSQKLLQNSIS